MTWPTGVARSPFVTEETKDKIRKARTGTHHSNKTKKKISLAHIGLRHSEETKRKIGAANRKKEMTWIQKWNLKNSK